MENSIILGRILGLICFLFSFVLLINKELLVIFLKAHLSKQFLLISGFLFSAIGIAIVLLHDYWSFSSWRVLITILGLLFIIEGFFRLLFMNQTIRAIKSFNSIIAVKISLYLTLIIGFYLILITFFNI